MSTNPRAWVYSSVNFEYEVEKRGVFTPRSDATLLPQIRESARLGTLLVESARTGKRVTFEKSSSCYPLNAHVVLHASTDDGEFWIEVPEKAGSLDVSGKRICFTGTLNTMGRREAQARAQYLGAIVVGKITKDTDILVAGNIGRRSDTQKRELARSLDVFMISEQDWLEILTRNGVKI